MKKKKEEGFLRDILSDFFFFFGIFFFIFRYLGNRERLKQAANSYVFPNIFFYTSYMHTYYDYNL